MLADQIARAGEIKNRNEDELFTVKGVTAVGVGLSSSGGAAIHVFVTDGITASQVLLLLRALENVPVEFRTSGRFVVDR